MGWGPRGQDTLLVQAEAHTTQKGRGGKGRLGRFAGVSECRYRSRSSDPGHPVQFRVLARWETAKPVRLAGAPEVPELTGQFYVIRLRGLPLMPPPKAAAGEVASNPNEAMLRAIQEGSRLERRNKPGIPCAHLFSGSGDAAAEVLLFFPKGPDPIAAPDKLVHSFANALPGRWYRMAAMLNGAGTLAFAGRLLGAEVAALEAEAATNYRGPGGLTFLPYLSGERTPHDDPHARGVAFGLTESTSRADLTRAVMEGVALALADARDRSRDLEL